MADSRIAVVGSGIAGLSAAWLLSRRYGVTLFEANDYLGGHTNTVDVTLDGVTHPVDTGFLVFNDRTYPNLVALFRHLGVREAASEMSFSVRLDDEGIEWAGASLATVFAQKRNLVRPEFWSMLGDILRFNREASNLAQADAGSRVHARALPRRASLRPSLSRLVPAAHGSGDLVLPHRPDVGLPGADVFPLLPESRPPPDRRTAPSGGPFWAAAATTCDGSPPASTTSGLRPRFAGAPRVRFVEVETATRRGEHFDQVVLACHSDQSLAIAAGRILRESDLLGRIRYEPNVALLHTDADFLPRSREAWSAWNYHAGARQLRRGAP